MTPNLKVVYDFVKGRYGPHIGVTHCRFIAGSLTYSQHSWSNAGDIYVPDKATGDLIVADLKKEFKGHYRYILWWRKNHYNHIHIDMWPHGYSVPPCKNGALRIRYKSGKVTVSQSFPLTVPIPEGDEKELKELIQAIQTALNAGGFKGANGKALTVDGILGTNTQFALNAQATAAAMQDGAEVALAEASRAHTRLNRLHTV